KRLPAKDRDAALPQAGERLREHEPLFLHSSHCHSATAIAANMMAVQSLPTCLSRAARESANSRREGSFARALLCSWASTRLTAASNEALPVSPSFRALLR